MVYEDSHDAVPQQRDRIDLRERYEAALRTLGSENHGVSSASAGPVDR
jgi:hypothetical protein